MVINAETYIGTIWRKLLKRNLINFKDPPVFSKTVFIKTTYFADNLVNYYFENQDEQKCQTIKDFNKGALREFLVTTKRPLSAEKFYTKTNIKILH